MTKRIPIILILLLQLIVLSCSTVQQQFVSEQKALEKRFFRYREVPAVIAKTFKNPDGSVRLEIQSPLTPGLTITGELSREGTGYIYYITGARLFSNWEHGWTEGYFQASGIYTLRITDSGNTCLWEETDPFKIWDIVSGEIRYFDTYYRKDDGLWRVRNRIDRLKETAKMVQANLRLYPEFKKFKKETSFFLFPELQGFKKLEAENKLPQPFYEAQLEPEVTRGSEISWRKDYTQSVFPQHLWEIRNTGTMYRDVEEAPLIFFSLCMLRGGLLEALKAERFIKQ